MEVSRSNRIAKNTFFLYFRSIIVMCVSIYTSRIVLEFLGVDNYGIYNVVGGVVAMFSMFSATLISSSQRFFAYSIGLENEYKTQEVFTISLKIHIILALLLFVLIEIAGTWYVNNIMNVPKDKIYAANWVLQLSAISFVINLISVPYNALIVAHEKMNIFAYVSIYEAIAKLGLVYLLGLINYERLIFYAIFILTISLTIRIFYGWYCKRKFRACKLVRIKNKNLYKQFLSFSSWNFLGSSTSVLYTNGLNLILNFYCGVAINAAKGVSGQIQSAVMQFVGNFMLALDPQIMKSYAKTDYDYLNKLIYSGTRLSFILVALLIMPLVFTMNEVLHVWLTIVPPYTTSFAIITLLSLLIYPFSTIIDKVLSATGKIKEYQIETSIVSILILPCSALILWLGFPPYSVFIMLIFFGIVNLMIRIYNMHKYFNRISVKKYVKKTILKPIGVLLVALIIPVIFKYFIYTGSIITWFALSFILELSMSFSMWFWVLKEYERIKLKTMFIKFFHKYYENKNSKRLAL